MPTVCIDCRYIHARPSGIGEFVAQLISFVPSMAPELSFLFLRNSERKTKLSDSENVTEISVKAPANGPATMWRLSQIVELKGVDVFHAPSNILPSRLAMKTITTVHDIMWLVRPELCNPKLYGRLERLFYQNGIRRALRQSDHITSVSDATRDAILKLDPSISDRVTTARSGVSQRFRYSPLDRRSRETLGITPGKRYVLTVGQSAPYKNHTKAIAAFAMAFGTSPEFDLFLVQRRGSQTKDLERIARKFGVSERIHFTGPIDEELLIKLYSDAVVLLHPSLCEGFGNPIAEAMACGTPIITSDLSAMPEVTGNAALLVNPNDVEGLAKALQEVAFDEGRARSLEKASLERARALSWRECARQHVEIYKNLLA